MIPHLVVIDRVAVVVQEKLVPDIVNGPDQYQPQDVALELLVRAVVSCQTRQKISLTCRTPLLTCGQKSVIEYYFMRAYMVE